VRVLLEYEADPNIQDKYNGYTSLIMASRKGHTDIVRVLTEHKADLNIQNYGGNTALLFACAIGHTDIVRLLVDYNADPKIRNKDGKTAFDVAKFSMKLSIENQIRWNRRRALMIMLAVNGYTHSSSSSPTISDPPLRFGNVFGNDRLLRLIVSYI